jgi:hypothetical protein
MGEAEDIMRDIYPNAEYRRMHSRMPYNEVEETREWFQNTDEGYLLAVNMISEGAHYKGVNTIIMFRRTQSSLVFNQQLGRIITLARDEDPHAIVFDLVNNAENLDAEKGFSASLRESYAQRKSKGGKEKSEQIIVEDYAEAISDVLRKIEEGLCNPAKPIILIELQKFYPSWHEPSQEFEVTRKAIQLACLGKSATCAGYHWAYADDKERIASLSCYIGMDKQTVEVVCFEMPNIVFKGATEAGRQLNLSSHQITNCCSHRQKSVGGKHFAYLTDYKKSGISAFGLEKLDSGRPKKRVKHLKSGIIYNSMSEAAKETNTNVANISAVLSGKRKTAGGSGWELVD